jgi:centriolar protein POC1
VPVPHQTVVMIHGVLPGACETMKGHSAPVRSVSFSANEQFLITSSDDKTVKVGGPTAWDRPYARERANERGDGRQVWEVKSRRFRCSLQGHTHWARSACFSPDIRLAVSGGDDKTVKVGWYTGAACGFRHYV